VKSERLFKVFFDLSLYSLTDYAKLTFGNFHSYLFLDVIPNKDVQFSFDVSSSRGSPSFYELDWRVSPTTQIRIGKIWIPFDDLSPHNLFGGRTNVSALDPDARAVFLPDLWTDLGLGVRLDLVDRQELQLISHLYIVNGFQDGGTNPDTSTGGSYPAFQGTTITQVDNNVDKAMGGRVQAKLGGGKLGIGGSVYSGRWNDATEAVAQRVLILGGDIQLRLKIASIRAGAATMKVGLPSGSFNRGGFYGEFGVPVGAFQVLARGGARQLDDRRLLDTDRTIVGGMIIYKMPILQFSAEYSTDIKKRDGKKGEDFAALRTVIEL
jgi:hypothetical protein